MASTPLDRQALFAAIGPRIDALVSRAACRAKASLAHYDEVSFEELKAGILADLGRAIAALVEGRPLTDADRSGMGQIGDARARQGIPLEAMLQVYRFTVDEIFNELWVAAEDGVMEHAQVVSLTRDIWQYADPMMDVAVRAYRTRELQQAVVDSQSRSALVQALLLTPGGAVNVDPVLGAHLDRNATYVAIRARPADGDLHGLLLDLQTPGALDAGAVAPHEGDAIGYARTRPAIVPAAGVIIGVGPSGALSELPRSFAIASRAVETAVACGQQGVRSLEQLTLEAIAWSEDVIGGHLATRYVDACEPGSQVGKELLDTIAAVLAAGLSVEHAASALFVHPNTVRNRVRRYEGLTGSSLRDVDDIVRIRLALLRHRMA